MTATVRSLRDHRVVGVAVVAWASALVCVFVPDSAWVVVGAGGVLAVLATVLRRPWSGVVAVTVILAAAVAATVAMSAGDRAAVAGAAGRSVAVEGTVATKVEPSSRGGLRFDVEAERVLVGGRNVGGGVTVSVEAELRDGDGAVLDLGSRVVVEGPARTGDAGDRAAIRVGSASVQILAGPPGVLLAGARLRSGFVELAAVLPRPGGGLLPGLAVGDTSAVPSELDVAMKQSSLSHLTAVSGANCAIVVWLAFGAASALRAPRWMRIVAGGTTLVAFIVLVTPEPSVIRAGAMAGIALVALAIDRRRGGLAVLSVAVAVLLIADPWLSTSLGFALSAAATAALLVLAPPLAAGLGRWMPRPLALALSVPLAAQLACGPLLVLIDPAVPLHGVAANLVAGPAAPVATVVGLAACLFAGVPGLGVALAWVAWLPSTWIASTATVFADLPAARVPWLEGGVGAVALLAVGALIAAAVFPRSPRPGVRRIQRIATWIVAAAVGAAAGSAVIGSVLAPSTVPRDWSVAQCDVGQGDAVVLRSRGAVMLIDTGPEPAPLSTCLTQLGVDRVDVLVLTHFDLDHVGGVDAVRGRVEVVVHGPPGEPSDQRLVDALVDDGARAVSGATGVGGGLGSARWRVLWPRAGSLAYPAGNDASLVLDVREDGDGMSGMPAGLYRGDLAAGPQRALLASGALRPPYAVVKVAHHGSADQAPELYSGLDAAIALIGVGADNDFGHPRDEALALVSDAVVVRSDVDGLGIVRGEHGRLAVWRAR